MSDMYRGTVRKVVNEGVYVEIPELGVGMQFGPCETCVYVEVGDRVLTTQVAGVKEDIVVVGRLMNKYDHPNVISVNGVYGPEVTGV